MLLEKQKILNYKVLFVEDDPIQQKIMGETLFQLGYATDIVGNAKDGISLLQVKTFNLIILDLGLPDFPGEVIIDAVRKCARNTHALIIVTSAHADKNTQKRCLNIGADAVFVKPIYKENLERTIFACIENRNNLIEFIA